MATLHASRFLLSFLILTSMGCLSFCSRSADRAMYYWKTAQGPSRQEIFRADRLGVNKLYVRLFDVESDGLATPALAGFVADHEVWTHGGNREVVPVIFIVNNALSRPGLDPRSAARSLVAGVKGLWGSKGSAWKELQIDCDWTGSTKGAYFCLLNELRLQLRAEGRTLSVTIRLHQVKYRDTAGVPPVDRGMLMAYNLVPPDAAGNNSSILDDGELAAYLASVRRYPLPLDVALPIFSWIVQWEGERFIGLIDNPRATRQLEGPGFRQAGPDRFVALARGSLAGRSVEKGDVLVIDRPGPEAVQTAARMLRAALGREPRAVALFSLDSDAMNAFTGGDDDAGIEAVYAALRVRRGRGFSAPRVRTRTFCRRGRVRGK